MRVKVQLLLCWQVWGCAPCYCWTETGVQALHRPLLIPPFLGRLKVLHDCRHWRCGRGGGLITSEPWWKSWSCIGSPLNHPQEKGRGTLLLQGDWAVKAQASWWLPLASRGTGLLTTQQGIEVPPSHSAFPDTTWVGGKGWFEGTSSQYGKDGGPHLVFAGRVGPQFLFCGVCLR